MRNGSKGKIAGSQPRSPSVSGMTHTHALQLFRFAENVSSICLAHLSAFSVHCTFAPLGNVLNAA